jgi:hypothetical protein
MRRNANQLDGPLMGSRHWKEAGGLLGKYGFTTSALRTGEKDRESRKFRE